LDQLRGDFEQQGGSNSLLVRMQSPAGIDSMIETIADDQRLGSTGMSEKAYYARMTSSGAPLQVLGFSVAIIMAIGSAFAATNTMYAAVARRSREIGTLRAGAGLELIWKPSSSRAWSERAPNSIAGPRPSCASSALRAKNRVHSAPDEIIRPIAAGQRVPNSWSQIS
jgi:hypothetical protein